VANIRSVAGLALTLEMTLKVWNGWTKLKTFTAVY